MCRQVKDTEVGSFPCHLELLWGQFWCLSLILENSLAFLLQIFLLSYSLFSFWCSNYMCVIPLNTVLQFLEILFFYTLLFFSFVFWFKKVSVDLSSSSLIISSAVLCLVKISSVILQFCYCVFDFYHFFLVLS